MKISLNWLKEFIHLDLDSENISQYLTDIGLEVEGFEEIESVRGGLKGVVIGEIISCKKHPNADRLNQTIVNIGEETLLNIICGAPNVKAGQKVPVATVGTTLYNGDNSFKIKKSKIRGEISEGMICGEDELGLGDFTEGIMVLDSDAKIGMTAFDYFNIKNDIIFDIGLTPNRSDAMGHLGVARDLKAVLNHKGLNVELCLPTIEEFSVDNTNLQIDVEVENSELCPRYSGVSISGVKVGKSPAWIENKLRSIGITPINNVVDITNYVLHETGHPLHAFDASKIKGNKVIVRNSSSKTKFIALDESEKKLSKEDLMIYNEKDAMCIAGVFGGIDSGVSVKTKDIFLESAYFNPISIRKTAKRYNLNTDASFRFERGCDINMTIYALKRASLLIQKIAGGNISSKIIDVYPKKIERFKVNLTYKKLDDLTGEKIDRDVVKSILTNLEIEIVSSNKDSLALKIPLFRSDVQREVDVIEEILRIYGFNNIRTSSRLNTSIFHSNQIESESIKNMLSNMLSSNGFSEIMNNSITKSDYHKLISDLDEENNVMIINPLSKDLDVMRQSLLFSGLETISYNINRKHSDLKLFEFGKTYHKQEEENVEIQHLQILVSGRIESENWNKTDNKVNFYVIKEKVEYILSRLGIVEFKSSEGSGWGCSYSLTYSYDNKRLVCFGKISKDLCDKFGIKSDVFMADFNWDTILNLIKSKEVRFSEVSKYPSIRRDLSLLLDKNISFKELKDIATKIDDNILKSINLFDVYQGKNIPEDKKSYALSFIFSDISKTLTDKLIDKVMTKLIKSYERIGVEVRKD